MALLSPGVQVSVIDQSNYTPAAAGSTPYLLIATAENKISGAGTGIAPGTLAANANKVYLMTSQRDDDVQILVFGSTRREEDNGAGHLRLPVNYLSRRGWAARHDSTIVEVAH